jgi:hypothetical protein
MVHAAQSSGGWTQDALGRIVVEDSAALLLNLRGAGGAAQRQPVGSVPCV